MLKKPNIELVKDYLGKDNPASFDFKLMNNCLQDISDELERILAFRRKSTKVPDPDCCELTMSIMCLLLEKNGISVKGYKGRHIYLKDDTVIETDTANSFISLYKGALMQNLPNYSDLKLKYGITGGFTNNENYEKIYAHRDEFSLEGYNDQLLIVFKQFACLTHTIGNFIVGPKGFNAADKKSKAKLFSARLWSNFDRIDKFLECVAMEKTYISWEKWFSENCFSIYNNYFYKDIIYQKGKDVIDLSQSKLIDLGNENMIERIKLINEIILLRGNAMVKDLQVFV